MSRIRQAFAALDGGKALIPYIAVGDPDIRTTLALMHGMVASGADILELGVPFSDPMADGPVIQRAAERALANGFRCAMSWMSSENSVKPTRKRRLF